MLLFAAAKPAVLFLTNVCIASRKRCTRQLARRCIRRFKLEERNFLGSSVAVDTCIFGISASWQAFTQYVNRLCFSIDISPFKNTKRGEP